MDDRERIRQEELDRRDQMRRDDQAAQEERWKMERDMMQQSFVKMVSERDEQARQERKEDKRKEAIPKLSPMTEKTDLLEYLEMFEDHMHRKEIRKIGWCGHLMPLLNDERRTAATHLEPDEREVYDTLKEELISTRSESARRARECLREREGTDIFRILSRLANRFATGGTIREAMDKVVLEKLLQTLPRQAATSIWDKEPKTSKEAARLAQYYFQDRNVDMDDPRWMGRGDDGDYLRSHRSHHDENLERYPERFDQGRSYGDD